MKASRLPNSAEVRHVESAKPAPKKPLNTDDAAKVQARWVLPSKIAVIAGSPQQDIARQFIAFIMSDVGQEIVRRYGF